MGTHVHQLVRRFPVKNHNHVGACPPVHVAFGSLFKPGSRRVRFHVSGQEGNLFVGLVVWEYEPLGPAEALRLYLFLRDGETSVLLFRFLSSSAR